MSWSEIPTDIFHQITKRIDVVDIVRSGCVCAWWHSISCREFSCRLPIPWLMLSSEDDDKIKSRYFYSLTENRIYEFLVPEISGQHCIGSSHGYLLSLDHNSDLIATNPLAGGAHLPLPPTSALPGMAGVVRDSSSGRITDYEINTNGMHYTAEVEYVQKHYYRKAILSPDLDTVVVIQGSRQSLAFARVGGQSWAALEYPRKRPDLDDIIFYKGRLHALDFTGAFAVYNLNRPSDPPFTSPPGPLSFEDGAPRRYLVESPCGKNLFLVCKLFKYIFVNEVEIPRTNNFKVYVLDENTYTWKQIKTLGDVSLFLGFNYSMSVSTREFPGINRNCIYFTDDYKEGYINDPKTAGDMGVFNLDDISVGPLYHDSNLDRLNWPPPIWFAPTKLRASCSSCIKVIRWTSYLVGTNLPLTEKEYLVGMFDPALDAYGTKANEDHHFKIHEDLKVMTTKCTTVA